MSIGTLPHSPSIHPDSKTARYKTPQELFSTFNIPDLESTTSNSKNKQVKSQTSSVSNVYIPKEPEKSKPKLIKPNIINPTAPVATTNTSMQPSKLITTATSSPTTSKPLLVQGHSNIPPFYYMNQGNGGYVGYSAPFSQGTFPPAVYGMAPPYMDPRYLYASQGNVLKREQTPTPTLAKEIKIMDSSQISSALKQSFATIQGQMAANQIPLCLVQDSQGQLHQLVYTVPENLYEKYLSAAKKGFKVRVQPQMDSLKVALTKSETYSVGGDGDDDDDDESGDNSYPKKLCDEDLKLVKEIPHHKTTEKPIETTNKKINTAMKNDIESKNDVKKSDEKLLNCSSMLDCTPVVGTPTMLTVHKNAPDTNHVESTNNNNLTKSTHQTILNDSINVTKSLFSSRGGADPSSVDDTNTSITKEFLSVIARNRLSKMSINSMTDKLGGKQQDNNMSTRKSARKDSSQIKTPVTVDLTTSSTRLTGGSYVKEMSKGCLNNVQPTKHNNKLLKQHSDVTTEIEHHQLAVDPNKDNTPLCYDSQLIENTCQNTNYNPVTNRNEELLKTSIIDSLNSIDNANELQTNLSTIDDILARNNSDLIPKSDVEALLKCLKRKLEESDIVDSLNKRHKLEEESREQNKPINTKAHKFFHVKSNSYDYESSDVLSPETLSEEGSPCSSVFYSSTDTASISSPESTLSHHDKSVLPGIQPGYINDSGSITEVLFGVTTDGAKRVSSGISNSDITNKKHLENEVKIQNSNNAELDFFDHLKDVDFFDSENFLCQELVTAPSEKTITNTTSLSSQKLNTNNNINSNNNNNNNNNNNKKDGDNYETGQFSFPSGQQNIDMDLFDHLWCELDNL